MRPAYVGALLATLALGVGSASVQAAKLYKWKDANGEVHYSQTKPSDAQAEEMKVQSAPVSAQQAQDRLKSLSQKANDQMKDRQFAKTTADETKSRAERLKKNCEIAKQNLRILQNASRVQAKDDKGKPYFLDDKARQQRIQQTQQQIKDNCGS